MKKVYFLIGIFCIILIGCEKDEINPNIAEGSSQEIGVKSVDFQDLPRKIFKNSTDKNITKSHGVDFGQVRRDIPAYINYDSIGTTYTIALNKNIKNSKSVDGLYFDNLVVHELPNGEVSSYIFRYTPELSWYRGNRKLSDYSGGISFFDLNGIKLGNIILENGEMANVRSDTMNKGGGCKTFKLDHVVCIDAGESGSGVCTYYYVPACNAGPSEGDGFPDPNNPVEDQDWGDAGDGDSPSDGGSPGIGGGTSGPTTNPIINEDGDLIPIGCPEGEEPNIFGFVLILLIYIILTINLKERSVVHIIAWNGLGSIPQIIT